MSDDPKHRDPHSERAARGGEAAESANTGEIPAAEGRGRLESFLARFKVPAKLFGGKVRTTTLALCALWIVLYLLNGHYNPTEEGGVQGPQPVSDLTPAPRTTSTPPPTTEPTITETQPTETTTTIPSPSTSSGTPAPGTGRSGGVTTTTTPPGGLFPPFFVPQQEDTSE